jgi:hypothetical protein
VVSLWSLGYAAYRAYYAAGGRLGMFGEPVSEEHFRAINAVGAGILLLAAAVPLVAVRVRAGRALPVLGWIGAVGCCVHALVDITLRLLSVTGVRPTQLPASVWLTVDRQAADRQDLLLNEPWFLVEGLLWAALGAVYLRAWHRRAWTASAVVACLLLTGLGVLSGLGVIGSFRLG